MCLPRPESPSLFGAILDRERGGALSVRPASVRSISRRYLEHTNVLETTYACDRGTVRTTDAVNVCSEAERCCELRPDDELVRRVECVEGEAEIDVDVWPRPNYARADCRMRDAGRAGIFGHAGAQSFAIRSDIPLVIDPSRSRATGRARLTRGQCRWIALGHTAGGPGVIPMLGEAAQRRLDTSIDWWRRWVGGCSFPSVCPEQVARSAIALKSLVHPPSGAVVAAPTTSLPEWIGGERNWDYRYCWIRDASLTMRAFLRLGTIDEAHSFFSWLLYTTRLTWPRLRVLYDVHGRPSHKERSLDHLSGYRGSRPVRIGNAARSQRQLDAYGALLDAAWQYHEADGQLSRKAGRMLRGFVETARDHWRDPDAGIWEIRSGERQHTLSKAMCWVAMERGLRLARQGVIKTDRDRLEREMHAAAQAVRRHGFNESMGTYTSTFEGEEVDASLLLLSIYDFEKPDSDRMLSTIDRIYERLGADGVLWRYDEKADGVGGDEGAFGICGFWGVEALALAGRWERAREQFDHLLGTANDVGLYSEEIDPETGTCLGNFPQAFTHVGLINAACALDNFRRPAKAAPPERKVG